MKTHRIDLLSLLSGIVVAAIGVVALFDWIDLTRIDGRWIAPSLLILLGIAVLASTGIGATRREPTGSGEPVSVAAEDRSEV
jgi:hypothetical protein